jgi:hypothetical protein
MTPLSRIGLLAAALALPVGALVVSYVSGADPGPSAPVEVRIGGPGQHGDAGTTVPEAERAASPVAVEQPAEIRTRPEVTPSATAVEPQRSRTVVETVVPPPPVVVEGGDAASGKGGAKAKERSKSGGGVSPPGRGRVAGNG